MTTLAHISANLSRFKRVPGWISRLEKPLLTGDKGGHTNTSLVHARKLPQKATPNLDAQIAAEELALAALIHSDLMSIKLPNDSCACLRGKTMPCRAIGGDFFDAIALTGSLLRLSPMSLAREYLRRLWQPCSRESFMRRCWLIDP